MSLATGWVSCSETGFGVAGIVVAIAVVAVVVFGSWYHSFGSSFAWSLPVASACGLLQTFASSSKSFSARSSTVAGGC